MKNECKASSCGRLVILLPYRDFCLYYGVYKPFSRLEYSKS